jgi:hypothetical protein
MISTERRDSQDYEDGVNPPILRSHRSCFKDDDYYKPISRETRG